MKSAVLLRLQRLLAMARRAEESRLAGALAEIAGCCTRAARLRQEIGGPSADAASGGDLPAAADMIAASRWVLWLAERAGAEEARAVALETEAAIFRGRLAKAFGRESVAASMLEKAVIEERRMAARRAEAAFITRRLTPGKTQDQKSSSDSTSGETPAGSPGIA